MSIHTMAMVRTISSFSVAEKTLAFFFFEEDGLGTDVRRGGLFFLSLEVRPALLFGPDSASPRGAESEMA